MNRKKLAGILVPFCLGALCTVGWEIHKPGRHEPEIENDFRLGADIVDPVDSMELAAEGKFKAWVAEPLPPGARARTYVIGDFFVMKAPCGGYWVYNFRLGTSESWNLYEECI